MTAPTRVDEMAPLGRWMTLTCDAVTGEAYRWIVKNAKTEMKLGVIRWNLEYVFVPEKNRQFGAAELELIAEFIRNAPKIDD